MNDEPWMDGRVLQFRDADDTITEMKRIGWWCEEAQFLYWRRPERQPHPDRSCDRPVYVFTESVTDA